MNQPINNLTFIVAPTVASLDNLLRNEFLDNPNIQNEENVFLLGDFVSTSQLTSTNFEFVWKSFPVFQSPAFQTDERGSKFIFCFADYDKRDHSLNQLARFAVWIDSPPTATQTQNSKLQPFSFLPKISTNGLEPLPEVAERDSPTSPIKRDIMGSPENPLSYPSRLGSASPNVSKYGPNIPNYPSSSPESVDQHHISNSEYSRSSRRSSDAMADIPNTHAPSPEVSNTVTDMDTSRSLMGAITSDNLNQAQGSNNSANPIVIGEKGSNILNEKSQPSQVISSLLLPETVNLPSHQQTPHDVLSGLNGMVADSNKEKPTLPRPSGDSVQQAEDGPVFRAQIADFEKRTLSLKTKFKKFLKRAITVHERQTALIEAHTAFLQSIQEIADVNVFSFQSLVQSYYNAKSNSAYFSLNLLRRANSDIHDHVIEPARKLYEQEIKSFDQRKKDFDEESREYYGWLSRYLSVKQEAKGKKKSDSDSKYFDKKRAFELSRFDYYTYLQDLNGGRKQQMITFHLALFAESEVSSLISLSERIRNNNKQSIDLVTNEAKDANKEWSRHRAEREVHRRAIERSSKDASSPSHNSLQQSHQSIMGHFAPASNSEVPSSTPDTSTQYTRNTATSNTVDKTLNPNNSASSETSTANTSSPSASSALPSDNQNTYKASSSETNSNIHGTKGTITSPSAPPATGVKNATTPSPSTSLSGPPTNPMFISSSDYGVTSPGSGTDGDGSASRNSNNKQGLLWAMSRPGGINEQINLNKPGWHKFWVVLGAGKLCEYTNWKQSLDLHNEPINLKVALVREARNAERRFCFEVVTPNYKRVYQTTSEEDLHSWIQAINNGISSSLEDSSVKDMRVGSDSNSTNSVMSTEKRHPQNTHSDSAHAASSNSGHHTSSLHQASSSLGGLKSGPEELASSAKKGMEDIRGELAKINVRKVSLHRRVSNTKGVSGTSSNGHNSNESHHFRSPATPSSSTTSSTSQQPNRALSNTQKQHNTLSGSRVATLVRGIDSSNSYCADCGSPSKVEWISINLLVVLCIECSGVHRSLGSHISKVRSLTLDTVSFNRNFIEVIKSVNNSIVNGIWEARLVKPKNTQKTAENRQTYIREKYIEKKYLEEVSRPNALLRLSVKTGNIYGILTALASGADPSTKMIDASDNTLEPESVLMYALRNTSQNQTTFPVAEVLILNSADMSAITQNPTMVSKLSQNAVQYLIGKLGKGVSNPVLTNAAAQPSGSVGMSQATGASASQTSITSQPISEGPVSPVASASTYSQTNSPSPIHSHGGSVLHGMGNSYHGHSNSVSESQKSGKPVHASNSALGTQSSSFAKPETHRGISRSHSLSGPSSHSSSTLATPDKTSRIGKRLSGSYLTTSFNNTGNNKINNDANDVGNGNLN